MAAALGDVGGSHGGGQPERAAVAAVTVSGTACDGLWACRGPRAAAPHLKQPSKTAVVAGQRGGGTPAADDPVHVHYTLRVTIAGLTSMELLVDSATSTKPNDHDEHDKCEIDSKRGLVARTLPFTFTGARASNSNHRSSSIAFVTPLMLTRPGSELLSMRDAVLTVSPAGSDNKGVLSSYRSIVDEAAVSECLLNIVVTAI